VRAPRIVKARSLAAEEQEERQPAGQLRDYAAPAGRLVGLGTARKTLQSGAVFYLCEDGLGAADTGQDYYLRWQVHERRAWR
jgi:hypothetical protein